MAHKTKINPLFEGFSGRLGDVVFYQSKSGRTMMRYCPKKSSHSVKGRTMQQIRFSEATLYAKSVLEDPEMLAMYEKKAKRGTSAYNAAIADFLSPPWVEEICLNEYTGRQGDRIHVLARDKFEVNRVLISIRLADHTELESGPAILQPNQLWEYIVAHDNPMLPGTVITATAEDIPGNVTRSEARL